MASATLPMPDKSMELKKMRRKAKYAFTCATLASLSSIIYGYGVGVMSGASLYIQKDLKVTDVQLEVLMGILNLYSLIGSFAAGRTSDWIGRRNTIVFTAAVFFAGASIMGFSFNYAMLMSGILVTGVGAGYAGIIVPLYIAEISPASARGLLTSFPELFLNLGILLSYVSNYAFARLPLRLGWRVMLGIPIAPSALLAVVTLLGMPESPRWLVMKDRAGEAMAVLEKTSDTEEEAMERLADIKAAAGIPSDSDIIDGDVVISTVQNKQQNNKETQVWKELILSPTPAMRRILFLALGIHFFQQASGIESVVLYSPRVFRSAGITQYSRLLGTTCAVGGAKMISTFVATFLLDRVGRRPLLLISTGGMAVSLVGLGVGLTAASRHTEAEEVIAPWAVALCIASILAYVSFFSAGLGPISAVYTTEIFPLRVRALGFAIGMACNRVTSGIVAMTFLSLSKALTISGSFFFYAGIATLALVFFFCALPETRGKTLEEMGKLFGITDERKVVTHGTTTEQT